MFGIPSCIQAMESGRRQAEERLRAREATGFLDVLGWVDS